MSHAQLFSSALVLNEGRYEYRALATATSAAAFVTQANSQGAQSFAFAGEHIFGDPNSPVFSVFGRAAPGVLNTSSFPSNRAHPPPAESNQGCAGTI